MNLGISQPQKRTVACKSNIFDSADKLIEDVCGRLKHHHPDLSSNDWNKTLTEMFFPIQDKNLHEQHQVLKAMKEKRPVDPERFQDLSPIINISRSPTIGTKKEAKTAEKPKPDLTFFKPPSGLPNGGNWCYLNSVLQCLRQTTELTGQISASSKTFQLICNDQGYDIASKLRLFLTSDETSMIAALQQLRRKLAKFDSKFNGDSQQCAAELCETMLRAMVSAHCVSSPVEIFQYAVKAAMKCRRCCCEREGAREEGIVLHTTLASNLSLQTSIENCWQYELLEKVQCVCGANRVDRKFNLDTAPNVLIVALKLNYSDTGAKLLSTVLNEDTVNVGQHRYKIFAVVSHIGHRRVTGHYIAYTEKNGNWNCFNDSTATRGKHWRSELEQDETPCIFFLRKISGEECIQSRQQHETSAQRLGLGSERFEHKESSVIENNIDGIEDLFQDEFDTFNSACLDLCKEMKIPNSTVSSDWMTFIEQNDQTFIKLSDCVYSSKHFAEGNAKCHFAWNPRTKNPMCIKVIENKSGNNHETEMLEKLMQHTGQKPGEHNIVKYYGHEVRQGHTCLKFEMAHPKNSFRKDLTNMSYRNVVTYMRELLKALDSLHNRYGITHRDIKPENFVHNFETNTFRLIDFGSAVYMSDDHGIALKRAGTRGYKAPELLQPSNSTRSKWFRRQPGIDIWSAGIILMSLLTAQKDILSRNDRMASVDCNAKHWDEIGNIVGSKAMKNLHTQNWSKYGDGCKEGEKTGWVAKAVQLQLRKHSWTPSDEALDLLSRMLNVCPRQRITSHDALKHPWLNPQWLLDDDGADAFDKTANTTIEVDRTQAVVDAHQTGSNTEATNVLARLEQDAEWTMAILTGCKGENYDVYFVKTGETRCVTAQNVKTLDWKYWRQEMQSWTCEDFKNSLVEWKSQKDWIKGKEITASDDCQIGTVIADCSECEEIGNLNMGSFNSTNDFNCELVRVHNPDMPCRDQLSGSSGKKSVAAFLVTTKYVHKGHQLTWFNADVGAAMKEGAAQDVSDPKSDPKSGCHSAVVEEAHSGSDTDIIPNGINVLAQLPEREDWTRAIVEQRRGSLYDVYSVSMKKTQSISRRNIRTLDWDYWKKEMKSWTYADFKDALAQWNVQVGAKVYPQMGRGLEALEYCQMGTVVAEYSGYIAFKQDGELYMGGLYPAMDDCMRQNISVRTMQDDEWKDRKNHCVTLSRNRASRFCIDGYATTCSMLDNLQDHGGVGWGALLNAEKRKKKCNCTLLWVAHPGICCVDPTEHLYKYEQVAAFLVTHKNVCKGDQLTWYYYYGQ
jgi:serine/threonine protein kinase